MLRGLRVATRTTRKLSNAVEATKHAYSKTTQDIHIIAVSDELLVRGPSTLVPGGGIEPPRAEARRILSPLRLPVPPSRLRSQAVERASLIDDFVLCNLSNEPGCNQKFTHL